jgi:hypothetical protein
MTIRTSLFAGIIAVQAMAGLTAAPEAGAMEFATLPRGGALVPVAQYTDTSDTVIRITNVLGSSSGGGMPVRWVFYDADGQYLVDGAIPALPKSATWTMNLSQTSTSLKDILGYLVFDTNNTDGADVRAFQSTAADVNTPAEFRTRVEIPVLPLRDEDMVETAEGVPDVALQPGHAGIPADDLISLEYDVTGQGTLDPALQTRTDFVVWRQAAGYGMAGQLFDENANVKSVYFNVAKRTNVVGYNTILGRPSIFVRGHANLELPTDAVAFSLISTPQVVGIPNRGSKKQSAAGTHIAGWSVVTLPAAHATPAP